MYISAQHNMHTLIIAKHPIVLPKLNSCDGFAKPMGVVQLKSSVDEIFPMIPHLDASIIASSAAK